MTRSRPPPARFAGLVLGVCLLACAAPLAGATEPARTTELNIASTFPAILPMLGDGMRRVTRQAALASGDTLLMRLHEPGVLVPTARSVTAVSERRIAAAWAGAGAGAGWFAGSDSAFNMFSTVPFGPVMGEYLAWMY